MLGHCSTVKFGNHYGSTFSGPSCYPTNSIKALKDDRHAATMRLEHCSGSVACLTVWLQGISPLVTMTVFLTMKRRYKRFTQHCVCRLRLVTAYNQWVVFSQQQ